MTESYRENRETKWICKIKNEIKYINIIDIEKNYVIEKITIHFLYWFAIITEICENICVQLYTKCIYL